LVVFSYYTSARYLHGSVSLEFANTLVFTLFLIGLSLVLRFQKLIQLEQLKADQKVVRQKYNDQISVNARLTESADALNKSNHELELYASVASHDLKEPLRMVSMNAHLLSKSLHASTLDKVQLDYLSSIKEGTVHMQSLLDDILNYSKVGKSSERIRPIDLDDIVYYVRKMMAASIIESNAQIIVSQPLPHVFGRYSELVQVFQNVIANAIKFRKQRTKPVIKISYQEEGNMHLVTIVDNGIGIDERHVDRVFVMFTRLNPRSEYNGTGIGLALCKKIVTELGGKVWLTSREGQGTSVHLMFPKTEQIGVLNI
jgi:light-regulated signal transduction histidine kinase (bacteriophytochrome)